METKTKIKLNRIKCKKCGDILTSEYTHDFKWCKCKSCAVDGGKSYLRRVGNIEDWEDLSQTEAVEIPEKETDDEE